MSIKKIITVSAIGLAMGFIATTAAAADSDGFVENYVNNSYGEIWKNSYGECWRDRFKETDNKLEECGYEMPEPVASVVVPEPEPEPEPEPVVPEPKPDRG